MLYFSSLAILLFISLQSGSNLALQLAASKFNQSLQSDAKVKEIRVGIINDRAKKLPQPTYPEEAKIAGISGEIRVEVVVDPNGKVILAKAISGHSILQPASVNAAKKAEFNPCLCQSVPVNVRGVLVYNFTLPKEQRYVEAGVVNSKAVKLPEPVYPEKAKSEQASGEVKVQVIIDISGNVIDAEIILGHTLLQESAIDAALKTKFSPSLINGPPVFVRGILVYNFKPPKMAIINALATKLPKPIYPEEAKAKGITGTVEVEVVVDFEKGEVVKATAISGNELLRPTAVEAAYKARFDSPRHFDGKTLTGILVYRFNLPVKKHKSTNINKNQ